MHCITVQRYGEDRPKVAIQLCVGDSHANVAQAFSLWVFRAKG